ncbi:MAG: FecR family protein [Chloroflexota bacterium]
MTQQDVQDPLPDRANSEIDPPQTPLTHEASSAQPSASVSPARSPGSRLRQSRFFRTRWRAAVTLLLGLPLLLCLGYWLFGFIVFADTATLTELKGVVQTRREQESRWQPAALKQLLWKNHWLRTGENSGAQLLFFDVSTVDLEPETEVSIAQIGKRRGGAGVQVAIKVWFGKTAVRAVRFVDPSSAFRVDTPTASTVVRGARFTVDVQEDGATQIDLEEGVAEVQVAGETITLAMGERITLSPDGLYKREKIFDPDGQAMFDKVDAAWNAAGDEFRLELSENEVNQYLAYLSQQQPDFFLRDTQIWFVRGEVRVATTVVEPARFDLSAAVGARVVKGEIRPQVKAVAAGVSLPLPAAMLNPALNWVFDQLQDYLVQAYDYIAFSDVQIENGYLVVVGRKQVDAPTAP